MIARLKTEGARSTMAKIGFIGTGHMGGSIALAIKDAPLSLF